MKTKKIILILSAAGLLSAGFLITNSPAREAARERFASGMFLRRAKERLDLSDDQVARIRKELAGEKDPLTKLLSGIHDTRVRLRASIRKTGSTEAEIRAASANVAAVEADMAVERAKLFQRISPILTETQMKKVSEFQRQVDELADDAILRFAGQLAN